MKNFNVSRYVRKFSVLIMLFSLFGACFIYYYGKKNQRYEAVTTIEYKNDAASEGYTPNGEKLDPDEIYSAAVVSDAIAELNLVEGNGIIRANGYVEPVISEEDQVRIDAILEKGEEASYTPTMYKVHFVADHTHSDAYARNVLTAIMQSYFQYYSEKYIEQKLVNNGISALNERRYEYMDQVTIMEDNVSAILEYLDQKRYSYPDFRSVTTGCSFQDLYGIYEYIHENEIPKLYSMIFNSGCAVDLELLVTARSSKINQLELQISELDEQILNLEELIEEVTGKNHDIMDYHYNYQSGNPSGPEYILNDVYGNGEESRKATTTYDTLLKEYVDLLSSREKAVIEKEYQEDTLALFNQNIDPDSEAMPEEAAAVQEEISKFIQLLNEYYDIVDKTSLDLNAKLGAENLEVISSVKVSAAINIKLYIATAFVFFFIMGVLIAVVLGRSLEFLEYLIYIDRKVDLPNRLRCDQYIEKHSGKLLPEHFSCVFLTFDNLAELSKTVNREFGDSVLMDFGQILKGFSREDSFMGYNEGGKFMCFFENVHSGQIKSILQVLKDQVEEYNNSDPSKTIHYSVGYSNSTESAVYDIRALLVMAMNHLQKGC